MKCEICNKNCDGYKSLGTHISKSHGAVKNYYDLFLKKENDGVCKMCGKETKFYKLNIGYRTTCSRNCSRKMMYTNESRNKYKTTMLNKYGVENPSQINGVGEIISKKAKIRLSNPNERKRISKLTKEAMSNLDVKEKILNNRTPWSAEQRKKHSEIMKLKHLDPNFRKKLYTEERNKKISNSKKEYWNSHPEERKRIMNIWKDRSETSLEIKMYNFLEQNNINFEKRYVLENKQYDAYLPTHNLLLEFDGEFWHPKSLEECKYYTQILNYHNDIEKNKIAERNGFRLIRIRENSIPKTIQEIL